MAKVLNLVNDKASIQTWDCLPLQDQHALHFALLSVDLASRGNCARPCPICPDIYSSPLPYSALHHHGVDHRLHIIPQASVLTGFANGRHWKEIREREEKSRVFLPFHSTCSGEKHLHYLCGTAPNRQAPCSSRFFQVIPPALPSVF